MTHNVKVLYRNMTICSSNQNSTFNCSYVSSRFSSMWTSCCSPFTSVPCSEGKCSVDFKSQVIKRWKFHLTQPFVLCISVFFLSASGCHWGQDQLHAAFESAPLKQQLFQKEENMQMKRDRKAKSIRAATVPSHSCETLSSESQGFCVYSSSDNRWVES